LSRYLIEKRKPGKRKRGQIATRLCESLATSERMRLKGAFGTGGFNRFRGEVSGSMARP